MAGRSRHSHVCGSADDALAPTTAHWKWHRRRRIPLCDRARAEKAWDTAVRKAGHPLPDYRYRRRNNVHQPPGPVPIVCGPVEAAEGPSSKHWWLHYKKGEPQCGRALAEKNWYRAEWDAGRSLPDYQFGAGGKSEHMRGAAAVDWDAPTVLYRYLFADGDIYWGISMDPPRVRWREQRTKPSRLGDKIRSGCLFSVEVMARFENRRAALAAEKEMIQAGPPAGGALINIIHNPD